MNRIGIKQIAVWPIFVGIPIALWAKGGAVVGIMICGIWAIYAASIAWQNTKLKNFKQRLALLGTDQLFDLLLRLEKELTSSELWASHWSDQHFEQQKTIYYARVELISRRLSDDQILDLAYLRLKSEHTDDLEPFAKWFSQQLGR